MTKLLVWSDYGCTSGFSTVASNILSRLSPNKFEIDVLGINFDGRPDLNKNVYPGRVWPAFSCLAQGPYNDLLGRQKLLDMLRENDYDTLFIIQDTFNVMEVMAHVIQLRLKYKKKFKIVYYFPIDARPDPAWIAGSVTLADFPVAYTDYGKNECIKIDPTLSKKISVCHHGTDTTSFYPMPKENRKDLRKLIFGEERVDKKILLNVNRNQPRKDIERSLMVLKDLLSLDESYYLHLHMSNLDIGGDLLPIADQLGLIPAEHFGFSKNMTGEGWSIAELNELYNAADCLITTTTGEGWGLSITEAMATELPVVGPDHTSVHEIMKDGRGWLAISGENNASLWTQVRGDNRLLRPLTDVRDMADAIRRIFNGKNKDIVEQRKIKSLKWVKDHDWDILVDDFWVDAL